MKLVKRLFAGLGILILLIIIAGLLIPVLFKDKILTLVKTEVNKQLNAQVDFKDLDLSIFKHFPTLTVSIQDIYVANKAPFLGDTLISAKDISISLDLMKAIKGQYDIKRINLNTPRINALVNEDGKASWDITKPDTSTSTTTESKPFALSLQEYSIDEGYIHYDDRTSHMEATIENLNHSGSGNFTSDLFTLKTKTEIEALSFVYSNIPYLNKVKTAINIDLDIDNKSHKYSFNTDKIQLNGLALTTKGFVQMPDTTKMDMDITFATPSNDFKDILSLIPSIYQHDFDKIKTSGKARFDGYVKGSYSAKQMPAYAINLVVENGSFKYPDLPQSVSDIQIKMKAENPDGVTDHTVVNLEKGHLSFGAIPFDFRLLLKTPVSNPWVDAAGKGNINLADMQQFIKLEQGTKLTGQINADVAVKGFISAAQKGQYADLDAHGTIAVKNMLYASKDYPDGMTVRSLMLTFNPKNVTVSDMNAGYLQTNFTGSGAINNLLGYYLNHEALSGGFTIAADKIDLNKWMGSTSATNGAPAAKPTGTSNPAAGSAQPFAVPANLNITLDATAGEVIYQNLDMKQVKASLEIKDETVYLKNVSGNALNGTIAMSGSYSTKLDKKNPDIHFGYAVKAVDIQQAFNTFNTVQKLMPIAKYLNGTVTTELKMDGTLDQNMSPVMSSLTGDGNVLLLQGVLSKFEPLEQLATKLNIQQLQGLSLKDVKTWFNIQNGRINVQPFKVNVAGINMEIGGSHGIDQTIQYAVNMAVPRSLMGSQGNNLINNLVSQASSKGVPINVGDVVNLAVTIGGTITKPTIKTDLKEVAGNVVNDVKKQLENEAKARVDSAKHAAKDTLNSIKKDVVNEAKNQVNNILTGKTDSNKNGQKDVGKQAEEKAKGLINNLFNKKK